MQNVTVLKFRRGKQNEIVVVRRTFVQESVERWKLASFSTRNLAATSGGCALLCHGLW